VVDEVVFYAHTPTTIHAKSKSDSVPVVAKEQDGAIRVIVHAAHVKLHALRLHRAEISRQPAHLLHSVIQFKIRREGTGCSLTQFRSTLAFGIPPFTQRQRG
jgi:hypothetical protein